MPDLGLPRIEPDVPTLREASKPTNGYVSELLLSLSRRSARPRLPVLSMTAPDG